MTYNRRRFLASMASLPLVTAAWGSSQAERTVPPGARRLKTSLNAYSFNDPLLNGGMSLADMLTFCAETGFEGVDITGYYFKGYPQVPSSEQLYEVKRKAFALGLEISGTGVRNDFTIADKEKRKLEVQLVRNWIEAASRLGAPVIRIFAGTQKNEDIRKEDVRDWMLNDIRACVEYGKQNGVVIGLQNHNDFIQTADQINSVIEAIHSEWLGIILDTGSYRVNDPYAEIEKSIRYAVNWQIKENVFVKGAEVEADISRIWNIIKASGYSGYLPIETLGAGDPKIKISALLGRLRKAMET